MSREFFDERYGKVTVNVADTDSGKELTSIMFADGQTYDIVRVDSFQEILGDWSYLFAFEVLLSNGRYVTGEYSVFSQKIEVNDAVHIYK